MPKKNITKVHPKNTLLPRLRILAGDTIALGPGKVELLEQVEETGAIREAADKLGMSYARAWNLIRTMNQCFKQPVVATVRGGKNQGGASLTGAGREAVRLYRLMEVDAKKAAAKNWKRLAALIDG